MNRRSKVRLGRPLLEPAQPSTAASVPNALHRKVRHGVVDWFPCRCVIIAAVPTSMLQTNHLQVGT